MTTPNMEITIGKIRMRNPVMVASGTFGYGPEYADYLDMNKLGALVVKGVSVEAWEGNRTPRLIEVPGGLVNAIGLQNPGFAGFVSSYMPFLSGLATPVIANIWGRKLEEYEDIAARFEGVDGVAGLELNVSCPNIKEGGIAFGTDRAVLAQVVAAVRKRTTRTLIVKLSPNVTRIADFAKTAEDNGADALSLMNTYPAMVIDIETRRPVLANVTGGLSGPAIHPIAVKLVYEAAKAVKIPIIGMGGIREAADAVEFLIAGASAVAVGTANFTDPTSALRVADGIRDYLVRHRLSSVLELVGTVRIGS
ncbi:MAG: dihydroorotate dehydrogenase [Kiritimatiellia bacterium]